MDRLHWLAQVSLFQDLSPAELAVIAPLWREETLPRGAHLFRAGDPCRCCYLVRSGAVKVYRQHDGRETVLDIGIERDILVELTPLQRRLPHAASAETLDRTTLLTLDREALLMLLDAHPAITQQLVQELGHKLENARLQIENMALANVRRRILRTLWWVFNRYSISSTGDLRLAFRLTHQLLAALTGTSRETVTRVLLELQDQHALGFEGRYLVSLERPETVQRMLAEASGQVPG